MREKKTAKSITNLIQTIFWIFDSSLAGTRAASREGLFILNHVVEPRGNSEKSPSPTPVHFVLRADVFPGETAREWASKGNEDSQTKYAYLKNIWAVTGIIVAHFFETSDRPLLFGTYVSRRTETS